MLPRHRYRERKHVVDERVKGFIHEGTPRQMRDGFQLVVYIQLRRHSDKSEYVHPVRGVSKEPRSPRAVFVI